MAPELRAGPEATGSDLDAARYRDELLATELPRVRAAATAWRNGLAGLLAALVGFGLVKGRSDVRDLAAGYSVVVGVLLLAALIAGAVSGLVLIRAAHGSPVFTPVRALHGRALADHREAVASVAALRLGIVLALACALLLTSAVGFTWYGPARTGPALRVTTPAGTWCGQVVRLDHGQVVLATSDGDAAVGLANASSLTPVAAC